MRSEVDDMPACAACRADVPEGSSYCNHCGAPVADALATRPRAARGKNGREYITNLWWCYDGEERDWLIRSWRGFTLFFSLFDVDNRSIAADGVVHLSFFGGGGVNPIPWYRYRVPVTHEDFRMRTWSWHGLAGGGTQYGCLIQNSRPCLPVSRDGLSVHITLQIEGGKTVRKRGYNREFPRHVYLAA